MTDLVPRAEQRSDKLAVWAEEARATHQIAVSLSGTSFVPRSMQGRPDEVTGCILAGRELGLDPMAALRAIDIIDGTPSIRAVGLRGIVQSQGHKIWVEESTATRAVVCGQRRGEQTVQRSVWTMDRAKTAGLSGKKNWLANPQSMLVARATAEVSRLIAADAIVGMPYTTEEIQDGMEEAQTVAPPVKRKAATSKRAVPEPELPDQWAHTGTTSGGADVYIAPIGTPLTAPVKAAQADRRDGDPDATGPDGKPTVAARAGLFAAFADYGITDRSQRLAVVAQVIGREVSTTNQLTMGETRAVIAEIAARKAARDQANALAQDALPGMETTDLDDGVEDE